MTGATTALGTATAAPTAPKSDLLRAGLTWVETGVSADGLTINGALQMLVMPANTPNATSGPNAAAKAKEGLGSGIMVGTSHTDAGGTTVNKFEATTLTLKAGVASCDATVAAAAAAVVPAGAINSLVIGASAAAFTVLSIALF